MKDEQSCDSAVPSINAASPHLRLRRPYHTPKLKHLGSVRELTFASKMGPQQDGAIASKPFM